MRIGKKQISKRLMFIVVPALLLVGAGTVAYAADALPFTDIAGHWAKDSIVKEAGRGVIAGHVDGTFGPDELVTRAQVATFLDRFNKGITCTECHNDTTLIVSKDAQFKKISLHGTGETYLRGASKDCAGCHGTEGPKARINAGVPPHDPSVKDVVNVSPMDCRTCHNIHTTYTETDFSLTGGAEPVKMEYTSGTFDKGAGNLCANCHQIRTAPPAAVGGTVTVTSSRYGPHHGVEASMLLGEGGMLVTGTPGVHYLTTAKACVTCHMGDESNHTFAPTVARCQPCHADLPVPPTPLPADFLPFNRNGVQTEIQGMLDQVKPLLIANGIMNAADGLAVPGDYPEAVAAAMWNYKFVLEDQCLGIHNAPYTRALLQQALGALQ